jgi:hypothetical protein
MMTADERYAANMAQLATHPNEGLRAMAAQLAPVALTNIQLQPNGNGQLIGILWDTQTQGWFGMSNFEDPEAEAEHDAAAMYAPQAKIFTLVGLGLGYLAVALAKRLRPYQRLSVWEPNPIIYKAMFSAIDVAPLFADGRVQLFVGPGCTDAHVEQWWLSLDAQAKLGIMLPVTAGYVQHVETPAYEAILKKTEAMMVHHMVGLSTWKQFGRHIGDNDLLNLPEYVQTPGYEQLQGLWANRPAVCVAAGPSLHNNLAVLLDPTLRHQVALLTVGTTFALVQGMHLQPDIVTTIDFQRLNWTDQFEHIPLDAATPLVYLHSTYPQTVRRWPGPRFVAENGSDVLNWLRPWIAAKGSAAEVQTVAHLNVLVALALGANPICLIGQDLAMPPTQHHAAGARAQDQAPNDVAADAFLPATDYAGRPTATRHSFLSMKHVFERMAAAHPGHRFLNCTEGGLPLAGIPNMPLAAALAPYCGLAGAPDLRQAVTQVWQGWTPTVQEGLYEGLAALRHGVDTVLRTFCHPVLAADHQRQRWQGRDPEEMLACDGLAEAAEQAILDAEGVLGAQREAFNLFVIRDFRMVEILSTVPTEDAWLTDMRLQRRLNADRLIGMARVMHEVGDDLLHVFREALRRLHDVVRFQDDPGWPRSARAVVTALTHQHYAAAVSWLTDEKVGLLDETLMGPLSARAQARLMGHYLYHTQQYPAALALLEPWKLASAHCAQMRRRLARYADDVRQALPRYFEHQGPEDGTQASAVPVCGD